MIVIKKKQKKIINIAIIICLLIPIMSGCRYDSEDKADKVETESTAVLETTIDTKRYDNKTDKIYKLAFQKAVTNQIPIRNGKEEVYYKDILQHAKELDEAAFLRLIRQSDYYYQDFDGDGLPELTVNTEGPCVLKYNPEEECVELYYQKGLCWNLLGTGQMFYYSYGYVDDAQYPEDMSVIMGEYAFETVELGEAKQKVTFYDIMTSESSSDWVLPRVVLTTLHLSDTRMGR